MLTFDREAARWSWDLGRIQAKGYTDNLVDLMVGKLSRLTAETQKAVQEMACLGNAARSRHCPWSTARQRRRFTRCWTRRFALNCWSAGKTRTTSSTTAFKRRPIYSFRNHCARGAFAHWAAARGEHTAEQREEAIYEIVNQLKPRCALDHLGPGTRATGRDDLIAGKRAKASTAYGSALNYLAIGDALLPEDSWERSHSLIFSIELNRAECGIPDG